MRVITGCPRSGTSFVCQIAQQLGADFGDASQLIPGNRWNQNGYFENRKLNVLNHRLMFGRWSNPCWWVDSIWDDSFWSYSRKIASLCLAPIVCRSDLICKRGNTHRNDMVQLGGKLSGITVKDPRFCHVLDAWLPIDQIESILFVVRNPWEVAKSLSVQTGLPNWLTKFAWPDTVDRFLQATNEESFFVVDFNELRGPDWENEVVTIAEFLGINPANVALDTLKSIYNADHQTHRAPDIKLPDSIARRYELLRSSRASAAKK